MTDDQLERHLRAMPAPELPASWRAEILATALREAHVPESRRATWPPLLVFLRNLIARNPFTAGALTALWILIFLLKTATPVDPAEQELLAHADPTRPIYFISLQDQIRLAELAQQDPEPRRMP
jgi:hypothetical protein